MGFVDQANRQTAPLQMTEAERGKIDHMFLACDVLGMDFQPNPHLGLFGAFLQKDSQKDLYDLDPATKKRLILWPRGCFKTSAVMVEMIQLILNYPNIRIIILSGSTNLAKEILEGVKSAFETPTEKFLQLYPEYCGRNLGNQSKFTVPNRTRKFIKGSTVWISTAKTVKAGSHCDIAFVDDLVNDQNYQSPEALEKCWQQYCDIGPLIDPGGYIVVTGTRYSFGDTYQRIIEAMEREKKDLGDTVWMSSVRTCWREVDGVKTVLFPAFKTKDGRTKGYTVRFLESEKSEKGDEWFACQYGNNPIAAGTQTFTDDLLDKHTLFHFEKPMMESQIEILAKEVKSLMANGKTFEQAIEVATAKPGTGVIPLGGWCFVIGDLSYVGDQRSGGKRDKCVFYIIRVVNARLYVIACHSGKWKSGEVADEVINILLAYRPKQIWIEAFLGWEAYETVFTMVAVSRGIQHLPIEWIPLDNQEEAKVIRIGSIHAWFARDKLYIFAGIKDYEELRNNLKKFPKLGRHDDHGDCLGLGVNAPHGVALFQTVKENVTVAEVVKQKLYPNGMPWAANYREVENQTEGNGCGSCIVS